MIKNSKIKLSFCIPTLNRGHLIGETLESIVCQATDEVEIVIVASSAFCMYAAYGVIVAAVLWGKKRGIAQPDESKPNGVFRPLCVSALVWTSGIMVLLVFMTAIAMSHVALQETAIGIVLLGLAAACYYWLRLRKRIADF